MPHPAQEFVDKHVDSVRELSKDLGLAYWDAATTGSEEASKQRAELEARLIRIYANKEEFEQLRAWRGESIPDELLARQVDSLYRSYLGNQKDDETIDRMTKLESETELAYANFRGQFEGESKTNNELRRVLADDTDSTRRKLAWVASKGVGAEVKDSVLELVRLRNESARNVGYADYYHLSLELQELDIDELFGLLGDLESQTREPFRKAKAKLDTYLTDRFAIPADRLMPWHYNDFFFQEAPPNEEVDLDPFFKDLDLVELATKTYDGIGLDVRGAIARSDLFPKDGKDQHAFCTDIDREGDVRMLCNLEPEEYHMGTLLHELGHAVYDEYLDHELPWLLREAAHTLITEAVAMIMGRLSKNGHWLGNTAGVPTAELDRLLPHIDEYTSLSMLIFVRWCLVMTHFERDMYADPEQDLNRLWWDYAERFQLLNRPEDRDEPDWAAKIHIALAPVYYHNYMLGEMVASQMQSHIVRNINPVGVQDNEAVGKYFSQELFKLGAKYPWNDTIHRVTSEPLNPKYFADQFVTA
jgi:peptidyl-dipeptidase A